MPFKRVGKVIKKLENGHWKVKQRCSSVANAKAAMRKLEEWMKSKGE